MSKATYLKWLMNTFCEVYNRPWFDFSCIHPFETVSLFIPTSGTCGAQRSTTRDSGTAVKKGVSGASDSGAK